MFVVVALADVFVGIAVVAAAKYNNDNSNNKGRQRITAATSEASPQKGVSWEILLKIKYI